MKIFATSDLHLEFGSAKTLVKQLPECDVMILAGDIVVAGLLKEHRTDKAARNHVKDVDYFMRAAEERSKYLLYIPGNHDAWGCEWEHQEAIINCMCNKYGIVNLQNMSSFVIDDVAFCGRTLWTDFGDNDPEIIHHGWNVMVDYDRIQRFTPNDAYREHVESLAHIEKFLSEDWEKKVVISHHAPSEKSIPQQYIKETKTNKLYVSPLDHVVEKADLWIHGHTHNHFDYKIGNARVLANPYGYHNYEFNTGFDPNKLVDI